MQLWWLLLINLLKEGEQDVIYGNLRSDSHRNDDYLNAPNTTSKESPSQPPEAGFSFCFLRLLLLRRSQPAASGFWFGVLVGAHELYHDFDG